ncbi:hypothetical protein [Paracraurococcus lichenis]|uniref:Uncharacterized protein n=1 Tax=Paracraurococcus lichenis TaxID=3064888 RepID=A0ABT9E027_9PROT|nr:hypothetical protein [Paracraurococcus sp. LOR1-02]MDO9709350.1 hypothetical protein [Paracraurococcus sp. LOR1-02]
MHPSRAALLALLLLLAPRVGFAAAPASCRGAGGALGIEAFLARTLEAAPVGEPSPLPVEATRPSAAADAMATLTLRSGGSVAPERWRGAVFIGGARSKEAVVAKYPKGSFPTFLRTPVRTDFARTGRRVDVGARDDGQVTLRMEVPENRTGWFNEVWYFVVAACDPANGEMLGFGVTEVRVNPFGWSVVIAAGAALVVWLGVARWAWSEHADRLQACWARHPPPAAQAGQDPADPFGRPARWHDLGEPLVRRRLAWKALRAIDPVFISQDALGSGSMARLQILAFTLTVGGVALYVFLRSGALSEMSAGVLELLGITAAGSSLAQLAGSTPGLSARSRQLLLGTGSLTLGADLPGWRDVVTANGEVDVTRVQALIFSGLAIASLVVNGAANLAEFALPQSIVALLGLSQGIYVFGKLVPNETLRQLEQQITLVRSAAAAARSAAPADAAAADTAFAQAKEAAAATAENIFGERFDSPRFRTLAPVAVPS